MQKPKPLVVLSLFDGCSGGQQALERACLPIKVYYSSEINRYAIQITQKNYPDTVQLGDINNWKSWDIPTPDIIIAGFPCQSYSNAGKGLGLEDLRGQLIYPMLKVIEHYHPVNFLLENVKGFTSKKHKPVFDFLIGELKSFGYGVHYDIVDSALVSAQSRQRLYITNWNFPQPKDRHIYLKDIIEDGNVDREKSYTIDANYFKGGNPRSYFEDGKRQLVFEHQSQKRAMVIVKTIPHAASDINGHDYNKCIYSPKEKSPTLNAHQGGNLEPKIMIVPEATKKGYVAINPNEGVDLSYPKSKTRRGRRMEDKSNAILTSSQEVGWWNGYNYRKLTPLECERLQTVVENYTEGVSNTQRYKMLGNGWTIEVLAHIFRHMNLD